MTIGTAFLTTGFYADYFDALYLARKSSVSLSSSESESRFWSNVLILPLAVEACGWADGFEATGRAFWGGDLLSFFGGSILAWIGLSNEV